MSDEDEILREAEDFWDFLDRVDPDDDGMTLTAAPDSAADEEDEAEDEVEGDPDLDEVYFEATEPGTLERERTALLAVVVHFYYMDGWHHVVDSLRRLEGVRYDLYVTVPANRVSQASIIHELRPDARVVVVPNHGKDCYPFVRLSSRLAEAGYTKALKLHTKRLAADIDAQWQISALDQLIPNDPHVLNAAIAALDSRHVAMIGPERYYLPLQAAITQVRDIIWTRLVEIYDYETADFVIHNQGEFGFFAGTMFGIRLDAFHGNTDCSYHAFPVERGQKDGTLAHALERLFCVVPQVENRRILQLTATALEYLHLAITAFSQRIPTFSLYVREKTKRFYEQIGRPERAIDRRHASPGDARRFLAAAEAAVWTEQDEDALQRLKKSAHGLLEFVR